MKKSAVPKALLIYITVSHCVPQELLFDQRKFESEIWKGLIKLLNKMTSTTALHLQSDGIVSRHTDTVNNYLSLFVTDYE